LALWISLDRSMKRAACPMPLRSPLDPTPRNCLCRGGGHIIGRTRAAPLRGLGVEFVTLKGEAEHIALIQSCLPGGRRRQKNMQRGGRGMERAWGREQAFSQCHRQRFRPGAKPRFSRQIFGDYFVSPDAKDLTTGKPLICSALRNGHRHSGGLPTSQLKCPAISRRPGEPRKSPAAMWCATPTARRWPTSSDAGCNPARFVPRQPLRLMRDSLS
jgi:hypothetical protein